MVVNAYQNKKIAFHKNKKPVLTLVTLNKTRRYVDKKLFSFITSKRKSIIESIYII